MDNGQQTGSGYLGRAASFGGDADAETTGSPSAQVLRATSLQAGARYTAAPEHRQSDTQRPWYNYQPKQRDRQGNPGKPKGAG